MAVAGERYASSFVRKERDGSWRGVLKYKESDGSWSSVSRKMESRLKRDARREVEAWRAEANAEAARGCAPGRDATVHELVARHIDDTAPGVESATVSGYRKVLKTCIDPWLGAVPAAELTQEAVRAWISELTGVKSATTAVKALTLLRAATSRACRGRDRLLDEDPTAGVRKPKAVAKRKNALVGPDRARVAAYVDIDPGERVSLAIRLALYCGLREGEICALRWRRMDIDAGTADVAESLGRARSDDIRRFGGAEEVWAGVYLKTPKTDEPRVVRLPGSVSGALRERLAAAHDECAAAGVPFSGDMFVIGRADGKPMVPHELWRRWRGLVTAMGLRGTEGKPPTFHDLRHTYATTALAVGIDAVTVANQLGHADVAMTLNTYASVDPDAARRAAERMDGAM